MSVNSKKSRTRKRANSSNERPIFFAFARINRSILPSNGLLRSLFLRFWSRFSGMKETVRGFFYHINYPLRVIKPDGFKLRQPLFERRKYISRFGRLVHRISYLEQTDRI